ncbi:class I SAM-dependent methyltransferase [Actinopolyspora mortivallis]|uniref:Methyltransferase type 11 n=1 Tax=Actinopolyspora mortivallis TaxID=33906 RepID=A0A2T0GT40_ACTMO|nr:methyltransferase domain-containing protein [Actinopolyspora mortivallis]PRW62288.1 methyltransferase type 11 [Actinopolyspora mortivallis]
MTEENVPTDPAVLKNCCAAAYGHDAVALVLGESYHPGGRALTRALVEKLGVAEGDRVVDVAAGPGDTARLLAHEYGARVEATELNADTVRRGREATEQAGLTGRVRFHPADAERLPLPDGMFDAVVCECAFCTFPDKPVAAGEFARLLRPGGAVGIADVTVREGGLPRELASLAGWIACVADARPLSEYAALLNRAGLRVEHTERRDGALRGMIDTIDARVRLLRMTVPDRLEALGVNVDTVLEHTRVAAEAAAEGVLGYALAVARKP